MKYNEENIPYTNAKLENPAKNKVRSYELSMFARYGTLKILPTFINNIYRITYA